MQGCYGFLCHDSNIFKTKCPLFFCTFNAVTICPNINLYASCSCKVSFFQSKPPSAVTKSAFSANPFVLPEPPNNFIVFNKLFEQKLPKKYKKLIDVLEATQFIRMLPFKCRAGEIEKAKFFYLMACKLLADIFKNGKYTN